MKTEIKNETRLENLVESAKSLSSDLSHFLRDQDFYSVEKTLHDLELVTKSIRFFLTEGK
jgi:hypothetical protein